MAEYWVPVRSKRCGLTGGGMSLGTGFGIPRTHIIWLIVSAYSLGKVSSQLVVLSFPCCGVL